MSTDIQFLRRGYPKFSKKVRALSTDTRISTSFPLNHADYVLKENGAVTAYVTSTYSGNTTYNIPALDTGNYTGYTCLASNGVDIYSLVHKPSDVNKIWLQRHVFDGFSVWNQEMITTTGIPLATFDVGSHVADMTVFTGSGINYCWLDENNNQFVFILGGTEQRISLTDGETVTNSLISLGGVDITPDMTEPNAGGYMPEDGSFYVKSILCSSVAYARTGMLFEVLTKGSNFWGTNQGALFRTNEVLAYTKNSGVKTARYTPMLLGDKVVITGNLTNDSNEIFYFDKPRIFDRVDFDNFVKDWVQLVTGVRP